MTRYIVPAAILATLAMVAVSTWRDAHAPHPAAGAARVPLVTATSREGLRAATAALEARLAARPDDAESAVRLADTLIRIQRVEGDATAVVRAERVLEDVLARVPGHYDVQRMLGAVLLSQHRFAEAIRVAQKARAIDPRDAWNYGVMGDAHLELGHYDEAFAAFDMMGRLRPGPGAYARVSYALELEGDLDGALTTMRMAAAATPAHDPEGQAWHFAQLGHLLLLEGRLGDAKLEFERAAYTFPGHPYAMKGLAQVAIAEGDLPAALATVRDLLARSPSPELAAMAGDLEARLGDAAAAERHYDEAEQLERQGWANEEPQPQALARFLAERDRDIAEAVRLAEDAASRRRDITTMDALAWSYFKAGRTDDAAVAAAAAVRTGTRDPRLLEHAATIFDAAGQPARARDLRSRMLTPCFDCRLSS
ncbi:MAG: tetratricopeptide repeat protein [Vicinamibacterales bacterium]